MGRCCLLLFASPCQNPLQFIVHLCTGQHTCPVLALVLYMRPLVHAARKMCQAAHLTQVPLTWVLAYNNDLKMRQYTWEGLLLYSIETWVHLSESEAPVTVCSFEELFHVQHLVALLLLQGWLTVCAGQAESPLVWFVELSGGAELGMSFTQVVRLTWVGFHFLC